jgi:hypothetical protein
MMKIVMPLEVQYTAAGSDVIDSERQACSWHELLKILVLLEVMCMLADGIVPANVSGSLPGVSELIAVELL